MQAESDEYMQRVLALSAQMKSVAAEGDAKPSDNGCAILYGIIRDSAYRIQGMAEREMKLHASDRAR